jgi:hypothetical protein
MCSPSRGNDGTRLPSLPCILKNSGSPTTAAPPLQCARRREGADPGVFPASQTQPAHASRVERRRAPRRPRSRICSGRTMTGRRRGVPFDFSFAARPVARPDGCFRDSQTRKQLRATAARERRGDSLSAQIKAAPQINLIAVRIPAGFFWKARARAGDAGLHLLRLGLGQTEDRVARCFALEHFGWRIGRSVEKRTDDGHLFEIPLKHGCCSLGHSPSMRSVSERPARCSSTSPAARALRTGRPLAASAHPAGSTTPTRSSLRPPSRRAGERRNDRHQLDEHLEAQTPLGWLRPSIGRVLRQLQPAQLAGVAHVYAARAQPALRQHLKPLSKQRMERMRDHQRTQRNARRASGMNRPSTSPSTRPTVAAPLVTSHAKDRLPCAGRCTRPPRPRPALAHRTATTKQAAARLGHNRACLALVRKLLRRCYHTLRELGEEALAPA